MAKCTITYLFDSGQVFQESWELAEGHCDPLPVRLRRYTQFYENTIRPFVPQANLPEWTTENIKRWGYLTVID